MSGRETPKRLASLSISRTIWWPFGGFCARPSWEVNQYRHNPDFSNWGQSLGLGDFPVFYVLRMSITGYSFSVFSGKARESRAPSDEVSGRLASIGLFTGHGSLCSPPPAVRHFPVCTSGPSLLVRLWRIPAHCPPRLVACLSCKAGMTRPDPPTGIPGI